jgi:hypothetical protein
VALGDDKQCTAISAGAIIDLSRRALGAEQVPEILTTRRQETERERRIAGLFRDGRAAEALDLKRADGTAEMAYGGYEGVVDRVAALYRERLEATGTAPTISAPTNSDAHRIGEAVRTQRRAMGLLGADRHRRMGRPAYEARPRAACLRLRDDHPHGTGINHFGAHQRTAVRFAVHRWTAVVFRPYAAPAEGFPDHERCGRADRGPQAPGDQ